MKIPVTRYPFVKTVASIGFEDGVVTSTKVTKGSQVLAFVMLPLDIAREVAKLPAEIIQLKFDISTKQRELIEAEQKLEAAREAARRRDSQQDNEASNDN